MFLEVLLIGIESPLCGIVSHFNCSVFILNNKVSLATSTVYDGISFLCFCKLFEFNE